MISNNEIYLLYKILPKYGRYIKIYNNALLEELVQETVIKAYTHFSKGHLMNWCFVVLKRKYLDYLRDNKKMNTGDFVDDIPVLCDIEEQIYCKELGKDWYDWPMRYSKYGEIKTNQDKLAKARIRNARNRLLKKELENCISQ